MKNYLNTATNEFPCIKIGNDNNRYFIALTLMTIIADPTNPFKFIFLKILFEMFN